LPGKRIKEEISAFEVARELSKFGDIYVVKDSPTACFVEFYEFETAPQNMSPITLQDVIAQMN